MIIVVWLCIIWNNIMSQPIWYNINDMIDTVSYYMKHQRLLSYDTLLYHYAISYIKILYYMIQSHITMSIQFRVIHYIHRDTLLYFSIQYNRILYHIIRYITRFHIIRYLIISHIISYHIKWYNIVLFDATSYIIQYIVIPYYNIQYFDKDLLL